MVHTKRVIHKMGSKRAIIINTRFICTTETQNLTTELARSPMTIRENKKTCISTETGVCINKQLFMVATLLVQSLSQQECFFPQKCDVDIIA